MQNQEIVFTSLLHSQAATMTQDDSWQEEADRILDEINRRLDLESEPATERVPQTFWDDAA